MKTLYIECKMGAAGDMLTAALLELMEDKEQALRELNDLGIPHVAYSCENSEKCGITGTHMHVTVDGEEEGEHHHHHEEDHDHHHHDHDEDHKHHHHDEEEHEHHHHHHEEEHEHHHHHHEEDHDHHHHHVHRGMDEIRDMIGATHAPQAVKDHALAVYETIARAEGKVHDKPITDIHFHEVGTYDAVADVMAVCYLLDKLGAERIVVSPIHVGSGTVHCAHGVLPVPAPATAEILKEAPIYGGGVQGELCTPTGAALLQHFAGTYGDMPVMQV
ncbi:MAG: LarC family nickel insertion protein, partial [Lachnospiraceae bacterium]|nr:LarC family nickel insertion protein [Lachnospiraceae bacterium]